MAGSQSAHAVSAPLATGARSASVLLVESDPALREQLRQTLGAQFALVEVTGDLNTAGELCSRCHFDVSVVEIRSPGEREIAWLESLRASDPRADVVFTSAYADLSIALKALRAGAADLIVKPFRPQQISDAVHRCLGRRQMMREQTLPRGLARRAAAGSRIVGRSLGMEALSDVIARIAPTPSTVLLEGETGTGKELAARAIHERSGRKGAFVPVNCGGITPELLESELFGHTRGAFTGAQQSREGLFRAAQDGTLFLDEISEMALPMQANLLRVLEQRTVRPVGANREVAVNCRVLAATNRELVEQVDNGDFRKDLYYRLNVLRITMPPLRDRLDDIPELARYFLDELSADLGLNPTPLREVDVKRLQQYPWPGNVRELRNVIERALLLGKLPGDCCTSHASTAAPVHAGAREEAFPLHLSLAEVEKRHMLRVLEHCGGNKSEAARRLGVSRKTLERKLQQWGSER